MKRPVALIIDDDPDMRSVITFVLEEAGFEVYEECDGEAGLSSARELRPDVVLIDWMMPRMSGIDACRHLRKDADHRSTAVILLSAKAQESNISDGYAAGAQDYIVKPFSPADLVKRVQAQVVATT